MLAENMQRKGNKSHLFLFSSLYFIEPKFCSLVSTYLSSLASKKTTSRSFLQAWIFKPFGYVNHKCMSKFILTFSMQGIDQIFIWCGMTKNVGLERSGEVRKILKIYFIESHSEYHWYLCRKITLSDLAAIKNCTFYVLSTILSNWFELQLIYLQNLMRA